MRKQTNLENKGVIDYKPEPVTEHSKTKPGFLYRSGLEFTPDLLGNFGIFIRNLVGESFVVELGCGSGVISNFCAEYLGLDGNEDAGNCCREGAEFFAIDTYLPWQFEPAVQADWLLSFNFLEHIEKHAVPNTFKYANLMLKPRGKIFFIIDSVKAHGEHVTVEPDEWWHKQMSEVGWTNLGATKELKQEYFGRSMPHHWREWGLYNTQRLFLYHK
jgi:hypothetical protein